MIPATRVTAADLLWHRVGEFVPYELPDQFCGLMVVAEAPGACEVEFKRPLVGPAGALFNSVLRDLRVPRHTLLIANVFRHRPDDNRVQRFFVDAETAARQNVRVSDAPPFQGRLLRHLFAAEVHALHETVDAWAPRVIVPLGAVATWALTGVDRISAAAGAAIRRPIGSAEPLILPTYHPASALPGRSPENRDHILATLRRALAALNPGARR